jgi:hypothetical protein
MGEVVLWDDWDGDRVVELESTHRDMVDSIELAKGAATVGELKNSGLGFAQQLVPDEGDEVEIPDATPFDYEAISDWVREWFPLPHDAEVAAQWLGGDVLEEHCDIGGASPGGHIDTYHARDPEAFLQAIRDLGYDVRRYPGLMDEYFGV